MPSTDRTGAVTRASTAAARPQDAATRAESLLADHRLRRLLSVLPGYGAAVLAVLLTTLIKLLLGAVVDQPPFLFYLGAVMLSAWLGGLGPGLLAELLSVMVVDVLSLPPLLSPSVSSRGDLLQSALFLVEASLIVLLASQLRGAKERAAASATEALDAVRTRNEFLAAAAHDLRAPLTAVSGYAQILRRNLGRTGSMDAAQATSLLGQIEESATHMAAMLEELLDLARLQAGEELSLTRTPTDLVALTMARVKAFETAAGASIRPEIDREPLVGLWDGGRLARVLDNLLSNAVKYSPNGGEIVVRLACRSDEAPGCAVLEVQDQGVGIPAADLPHIFERYHRASNVRNRIGGMGIGLAGVRQIVEQHGGSVTIQSRLGTGTTVRVSLPLE